MIRDQLAYKLGSLVIKTSSDIKGTYNRGDPGTAGGDLAYKGKQWMDQVEPTTGSNAPLEKVRDMIARRKKKGPQVTYEEIT